MIFKHYTLEEVAAFDVMIADRYKQLLDDSRKLVEHMMQTYKESQSEEDCDLLIEAVQHEGNVVEDICAYETGKVEQKRRMSKAFEDAMRRAEERSEAARRAEETQSLVLAVKRIDETVAHLRRQGQRRRQGFTPDAKAVLIKATEAMACRCPCCGDREVVRDGERIAGAEFDHFFANHIARADAGWLICQQCHRSLTHNASLRTEKAVAFAVFQGHRRAAEMQPQIDIGARISG